MKHSVSFMIAIVTMAIFGSSAYAQTPDWLEGKWLGDGIYDIEGNVIKKTEDGITFNLGEFTIDEGNAIIINGKESGLIVLNDDEAIAFSTNPNYKFKKYDNITFPEDYKWVIGSWTDGNYIVTFTEKEVSVKQGEAVVNKGIYYIDETTDEYAIKYTSLNIYWDKSDGDGLVLNGNAIAYEGGDNLIKLPEQAGQSEAASNNPISLLTTSSQPYKGNLKWLYGTWVKDGTEIYITPKYYQARRENDSYLAGKELSELEKTEYVVIEEENQILGKVIRLDEFYLDPTSKLLYTLSGVDQKSYMEKTSNYVSPVIRYGKWVLIGLIAIAALIALTIIVVRLVKKAAKKAKEKAAAAKIVAEQKRAELAEKTKALNDSLKSKASQLSENASALAAQAKTSGANVLSEVTSNASALAAKAKNSIKKSPTAGVFLLYSVLVFLFVDYNLGLIFSLLFLAYIVIKKLAPGAAESIKSTLKGWKEAISAKPLLAHGLILLLVAYLVWRELSTIAGLLLMIPAVIFLLRIKKHPESLEAVDSTVSNVGNTIAFSHRDRCLLAFLFVLLLLVNGLFGFVFTLAALAVVVLFFIALNNAEKYTNIKDKIADWYDRFSNSKFSDSLGGLWNKKPIRIISEVAAVLVILMSLQQSTGIHEALYTGVAVASGSYEDAQENKKEEEHSVSSAALDKVIEGKWRLSYDGSAQIISFQSKGFGWGIYTSVVSTFGLGMQPDVEIGTYSIENGRIKLEDASGSKYNKSYLYIEGGRISDGHGHYYSKSY